MEKKYVVARHGDKAWNAFRDFHYLVNHLRERTNREDLIGIYEPRSIGDWSPKRALVLYSTEKEDVLVENNVERTEIHLGKKLADFNEEELRHKAVKTSVPLEMLVKLQRFVIAVS